MMLAIFNAIGATLSLAAIVAFVLGVGIASDANILTFERIRDERKTAGNDAAATRLGLGHAWRTILDASVSGLIVATALFIAGVGPIRGFALTTIVSIVASILCSVLLVSLLMRLRFPTSANASKPIASVAAEVMMNGGRFNVLAAGKAFGLATAIFIVVGACSIATKPFNFDIDFKAGTALDVTVFKPITQDEAGNLIEKSGIKAATVAIAGANQDQVAARFDNALTADDVTKIVGEFKAVYGDQVAYQENTADPAVANALAHQAVTAVLVALALCSRTSPYALTGATAWQPSW
jgi:SecD/SecF fusion protein